jgi:hypothetical protein
LSNLLEVAMTLAQKTTQEINTIRRELAQTGADPFAVAAAALHRNEQLLLHIQRLEQMLRR